MTDPLFDAENEAAALVRRAETAEELARDAIQERDAMRAALRAVHDCRHSGTDRACLECLTCQRLDLKGSATALARAEQLLADTTKELEHQKNRTQAASLEAERFRRRAGALERILDQVSPSVGELLRSVRIAIATEEGRR